MNTTRRVMARIVRTTRPKLMHRFDAVGDLEEPARGGIEVGEGVRLDEFHS